MEINVDTLKRAFEENPVAFLSAAGGLLVGIGKIVGVAVEARNSSTWRREVNRRTKLSKKK